MPSTVIVRALRSKCRGYKISALLHQHKHGLPGIRRAPFSSTAGKKAELQDRIRAQLQQQHSSSIEQIQVEAILFSDMMSESLDDETVGREGWELLDHEAKDAEIIHDEKPVRWGNRKGLTVMEKLDYLAAATAGLEAETAALEAATAGLEATEAAKSAAWDAELDKVKDELALLKASSDGYLQIRNRFVAVYRRQVLKDAKPHDCGLIDVGNGAAHYGDPVTDALLYEREIRFDDRTYISLYGMDWGRVLRCRDDLKTLQLLAAHATAKADEKHPLESELAEAFETFICAFDDGGCRPWHAVVRGGGRLETALEKDKVLQFARHEG
ncbi:MAG: hypothetical protein M1826_007050 [Phylliscum demangeonii]|nr:MAG: hypothetical protein M1826_007050 [Phylliscum demangeonii]